MSSHGRTNFTTTLTVLGHFEISSWERGGSKRGEKNRSFSKETNVKILEAKFVKFMSIILSILFVVFLVFHLGVDLIPLPSGVFHRRALITFK